MKKLLLVSCCLIILSACTKQQKAEKLIKKYLDINLSNPDSYKAVSTKIDTFWVNKHMQLSMILLRNELSMDSLKSHFDGEASHKADYLAKISILKKDSAILKKGIDSTPWTGKKFPIGWIITHTYRAQKGFGAVKLDTLIIYTNTDFSKNLGTIEND